MEREITIDASGRLVIPKEIRRRHHLRGGARLLLVDDGERLLLIPRQQHSRLAERDGLLVFQGRLLDDDLDHRSVRDERLDRVAGL